MRTAPLLLVFLAATFAHAQRPLAAYVDQNRILLLFAPTDTDPRFEQQIALLRHHAADLKERDVLILPLFVNSSAHTPDTLRSLPSATPTSDEQGTLRVRFHIQPGDFAVILLGKDGGEKLRQQTPLTPAKLSAIIDAMPMRQDEMRRQK